MGIDLSSKKFFVTSGCSYGRQVDSLFNMLNYSHVLIKNGIDTKEQLLFDGRDEVIFINVSAPSQGSDWQSDSIIYTISKLIELGAKSRNIYCHIEFSEIGRIALSIDKGMDIPTDWLNWKKWAGDTVQGIYQFKKEPINLVGKVTQGFDASSEIVEYLQNNIHVYCNETDAVSKLGDTEYFCVEHWYDKEIENQHKFKFLYDDYKSAIRKLPQDFFIQRYIDNILKAQNFLKSKNIKYNFSQIYSQLSGWYEFPDGRQRNFHIHDSNEWFTNVELFEERFPKNESKGIEEVISSIREKFKLIDLDKFWFHKDKTGVFHRGGIDEYVIDTYGKVAYICDVSEIVRRGKTNTKFYKEIECLAGVTGHPDVFYYFLMFNQLMKDCDFFSINQDVLDKLEKLRLKDKNSDEISESLLFFSDKFADKIINNTLTHEEFKKFINTHVQNI